MKAMKRIPLFATILLVAASCSQQQGLVDESTDFVHMLTAYAPGNEVHSKTSVDETGLVYWSPADEISLFDVRGSEGGYKFTSDNSEPARIAQFTGAIDVTTGAVEKLENGNFWGVYPFSYENECDGSSVSLVVPSAQISAAGTFSKGMFPSIGHS